MAEIYAEDLVKLEKELEVLEKERAAWKAASPLMRRLKKDRIESLDRRIYEVGMAVVSTKEHVFKNPTSVALYETITARQREEDAELARARRQLEMEHDREPD